MAMDAFFDVVSEEKISEWEVCLQRLREDDPQVQKDAAVKLRQCVERAVRELSTESFEKFEKEVHLRVFSLLHEKVSFPFALLLVWFGACPVAVSHFTWPHV